MVDLIRDIYDPFGLAQAHAIIRSLLFLMVVIPEAAAFLSVNENSGPSLFAAMLDMAENLLRVPYEPCRRAYLATVICAIVVRFNPPYPTDPPAFYVSCLLHYDLHTKVYF